jgi:ribosomal RNA-processing protein 17
VQQLRQQRKVDLEKHVEEVNRLVKQANGELDINPASDDDDDDDDASGGDDDPDAEFTGFPDAPINEQDEYVDEDKYTTVTIETVGISRSGMSRPGEDEAEEKQRQEEAAAKEAAAKKRVWTKERPKTDRPKKKKVKFRYETKTERKMERMKQGAKKRKQAAARQKE